jgi:hypothetical protein
MMGVAVQEDNTNYEIIHGLLISCDEYPYRGIRRYNKFHVTQCPLCKIYIPKLLQLLKNNKIEL